MQRIAATPGPLGRWLLVAGLMLGLSNTAHANCRVIHVIDEMHTTQNLILQNPNTRAFPSHIRTIRRNVDMIDDNMLLEAIDAHPLSQRGIMYLRFTRLSKQLLERTSIDDPESAIRHFQDPLVASNMRGIGQNISTLRCSRAEVQVTDLPSPVEEDFGAAFREAAIEHLNRQNLIWAALMIVALFSSFKLISMWRAQKSRRPKLKAAPT